MRGRRRRGIYFAGRGRQGPGAGDGRSAGWRDARDWSSTTGSSTVATTCSRSSRRSPGSSFLALISTSGQPITTASDDYHPETLSLASLAASSFAATQQLARILDENEFTLLFHEGKALNLHVSQVTDQVLLIVTFGRDTQVGKVRLYTQRAIESLRQIFDGPDDDADPGHGRRLRDGGRRRHGRPLQGPVRLHPCP